MSHEIVKEIAPSSLEVLACTTTIVQIHQALYHYFCQECLIPSNPNEMSHFTAHFSTPLVMRPIQTVISIFSLVHLLFLKVVLLQACHIYSLKYTRFFLTYEFELVSSLLEY